MNKTKCWILMKKEYGDFDMPFETPVAVYTSEITAIGERNRKNNSRKESDKYYGEWDFSFILRESRLYE